MPRAVTAAPASASSQAANETRPVISACLVVSAAERRARPTRPGTQTGISASRRPVTDRQVRASVRSSVTSGPAILVPARRAGCSAMSATYRATSAHATGCSSARGAGSARQRAAAPRIFAMNSWN